MSETDSPHDFTPPEIDEISELLPAYEVLSFIAKGGMGAVYLARQKSLDRQVAIKILPRHFGEDANFRASFETEAKSMAKLNHPNLIGIYDFGQVDGLLYIIMEMVKGKSLYHSAWGKQIDPQESARIVTAICRGLANAHHHGILHRDIKPANILLDPQASPKIGDFGLARPAGEQEEGVMFGTPGYSAPEIVHNPAAVDETTDIFAVGVLLYELLTGKLPDKAYVPAASLSGCSSKFDHIIRKATHPNPTMRYRDADEMAEALEPLIKGATAATSPLVTLSRRGNSASSGGGAKLVTQSGQSNAAKLQTSDSSDDSQPRATASTPPLASAGGGSVSFIRNIIIIVALLAGIYIAWEAYQKTAAARAEENKKITEENKQAIKDANAKKPQKPKTQPNKKPVVRPTPPTKPKLTPMEQLASLRSQLHRGQRTKFPRGSKKLATVTRFYVAKPMTWHQAQNFCERHGGHLACLSGDKDSIWIEKNVPRDQTVWLGGGTADEDKYCWINGKPWTQQIRPTSKAAYVATNHTGVLDPQPAANKNNFFIEWSNDGKNPGSIKHQLRRAGASAASPTPKFPAGTISYDNRHFLLVEKTGTWSEARSLADSAGGTLAVASNLDESQWILSFTAQQMTKGEACWIGAYRQGEGQAWKWLTGEPWEFAAWADGCPDAADADSASAAANSAQKWDDFATGEELSYFLIEWSEDQAGHTPTAKNPAGIASADIAPIRSKCIALIKTIQAKHAKLFTSNINSYELELNSFKRGLKKSVQEQYAPGILQMQSRYKKGKIPDDLPLDGMPPKIIKILEFRLTKQAGIQEELYDDIESLREKYRKSLTTKAKELGEKGLKTLQRKVQDELTASEVKKQDFINYMLDIEEEEEEDAEEETDKEEEE